MVASLSWLPPIFKLPALISGTHNAMFFQHLPSIGGFNCQGR
jgi:hypothetical protein